jgi:hypothetical protein
MNKYYLTQEKAVIQTGNSSVTVYGETAKLVNAIVGLIIIAGSLAFLSKILK